MLVNVSKLIDEIKSNGFTIHQISKELNINVSTFYRKLKCPESFTIEEVDVLYRVLSLDLDKACSIFFADTVA